jgi:hypothetical protein
MAGAEVDDEIIASDSSMGPVGSGSPVVENTGSTSQAVDSVASDSSMGPANVVSTASFYKRKGQHSTRLLRSTAEVTEGVAIHSMAVPVMTVMSTASVSQRKGQRSKHLPVRYQN